MYIFKCCFFQSNTFQKGNKLLVTLHTLMSAITTGLFDFQSSEDKEELRVSYRKENEGKSFCQLDFILYHSCVYLKMEVFP